MEEIEQKINLLSKRWEGRVPNKFNPRLINDVRKYLEIEDEAEVLAQLDNSSYFTNVLWPFFEKDVSNSHLELVILSLLFSVRRGDGNVVHEMIANSKKFDDLIERVLQSTIVVDGTRNIEIAVLCIQLLGELVCFSQAEPIIEDFFIDLLGSHTLDLIPDVAEVKTAMKIRGVDVPDSKIRAEANSLRHKWAYSLIKCLTRLMTDGTYRELEDKNEDVKMHFNNLLESVVHFLTNVLRELKSGSCLVALIEIFGFVPNMIAFRGSSILLKESTIELKRTVSELCNNSTICRTISSSGGFGVFQRSVFQRLGDHDKVQDLLNVPSIYNLPEEQFSESLRPFTLEEIQVFVKELGHAYLSKEVVNNRETLVNILSGDLYLHFTTLNKLINAFGTFDETLVDQFYDLSDTISKLRAPLLMNTTCGSYFSPYDYVIREVKLLHYKALFSNLHHIKQVLNRVQVSEDKDGGVLVRGKSKYFSSIVSHKLQRARAEVSIKESRDWDDLKTGDHLAIVALVKPNKYSPHKRMKDFGLDLLRIVKVENTFSRDNVKIISFPFTLNDADQVLERSNYLIRFPVSGVSKSFLTYILGISNDKGAFNSDFFRSIFNSVDQCGNKSSTATSNSILKIEPVSLKSLELCGYTTEVYPQKKRKLNDRSVESPSSFAMHIGFNGDSVDIKSSSTSKFEFELYPRQTEALIQSLTSNVCLINSSQHAGGRTLLSCIIHNFIANFRDERSLVIVPNNMTKNTIKLHQDLIHYAVKYDDKGVEEYMVEIKEFCNSLLRKVSDFAKRMNLQQFDFDSSCENALVLYKMHISVQWKEFWAKVKENKDHVIEYPFAKLNDIDLEGTFEEKVTAIVDDYSKVLAVFEQLQKLSPLLSFKCEKGYLKDYLVKKFAKVAIASTHDVLSNMEVFSSNFKSVIAYKVANSFPVLLTILRNKQIKRLVVFHNNIFDLHNQTLATRLQTRGFKSIKLDQIRGVNPKIYETFHKSPKTEYYDLVHSASNPGLANALQVIESGASSTDSVAQSEYTCALYYYMLQIGYPSDKVAVVGFTQLQVILLNEVFIKMAPANNRVLPIISLVDEMCSFDYILAPIAGCNSYRRLRNVALYARLGLYIIGPSPRLPQITHDHLSLVKHETFAPGATRSKKTSKTVRINSTRDIVHFSSSASST